MIKTFKNTAAAFGLQITGSALSLLFSLVLARRLGPEGIGIYLEVFNLVFLAALVGRMGLDNAVLRFSSASMDRADFSAVAGLYRKSLIIIGTLGSLLTALLLVLAPWISEVFFSDPKTVVPLQLMALSIMPFALSILYGQLLQSINHIRTSIFIVNVLPTAFSILVLVFWVTPADGANGAVLAYIAGIGVSLVIGFVLWRRASPELRGIPGEFDTHRLVSTSLPFFWSQVLNFLRNRADLFILSLMFSSDVVGIYGVAQRVMVMFTLLLTSVNNVVSPRYAVLHEQENIDTLRREAQTFTRILILIAIPLLLVCVFLPNVVLGLFGPEFLEGAPVLSVLAIGYFVSVISGTTGALLMMTGHEKVLRNNVAVHTLMNLILNLLLIPPLGIIGAAIASTVSLASRNLVAMFLVRKHLSISLWKLQ